MISAPETAKHFFNTKEMVAQKELAKQLAEQVSTTWVISDEKLETLEDLGSDFTVENISFPYRENLPQVNEITFRYQKSISGETIFCIGYLDAKKTDGKAGYLFFTLAEDFVAKLQLECLTKPHFIKIFLEELSKQFSESTIIPDFSSWDTAHIATSPGLAKEIAAKPVGKLLPIKLLLLGLKSNVTPPNWYQAGERRNTRPTSMNDLTISMTNNVQYDERSAKKIMELFQQPENAYPEYLERFIFGFKLDLPVLATIKQGENTYRAGASPDHPVKPELMVSKKMNFPQKQGSNDESDATLHTEMDLEQKVADDLEKEWLKRIQTLHNTLFSHHETNKQKLESLLEEEAKALGLSAEAKKMFQEKLDEKFNVLIVVGQIENRARWGKINPDDKYESLLNEKELLDLIENEAKRLNLSEKVTNMLVSKVKGLYIN